MTCRILARDLNRTVYALDLRNHGESPHTSDHTYSAMAEDVEHFIHQHGIETPSLIGHSMGAKVAMAVALRNPSLLESIVSVDNAPVDAALKSDFPAYVRAMRNVDASRVKRQSDADKILQVAIPELPIRQFLLANLVRVTGPESHCGSYLKFRIPLDTLARSLGELGDFPFKVPDDGSAGLGSGVGTSPADTPVRFSKPALFVRGTRSRYVADEMVPITGRFFPLFKLADVEAGHWVISENPEEFRKGVFLFVFLEEISWLHTFFYILLGANDDVSIPATVRFYQDLQDD